ncbi:MAG: DUF4192 domain-containing protein [Mycobacteriales bacterium]
MSEQESTGVVFPFAEDGRRSTTTTGKAVWADAVRDADAALAGRIDAERVWRAGYVPRVAELTAVATRSPDVATAVARGGLSSLAARMRFERDGTSTSVPEAVAAGPVGGFGTHRTSGQGEREVDLVVPYRGEHLRGDTLLRQLDAWAESGTVEPSFAEALRQVVSHPAELDLRDRGFAVLGAGAELGPVEPLLRWGATVAAVDLPVRAVQDRLLTAARGSAGTLELPLPAGGSPDGDVAAEAGADLLAQTPEVAHWLAGAAGDLPVTVGSYAYADGARHVQVAVASDAVVQHLLGTRPGTSYAELATPTDAYVVPMEVVEQARAGWRRRGWRRPLQAAARLVSRGDLYQPGYPSTLRREDGTEVAVADVLVPQQGPNYTLAKRLQRWRATVAQADGLTVSANVAPATHTRSVTRNRLLAAAYAGAHSFGVEVFAPTTSRVLWRRCSCTTCVPGRSSSGTRTTCSSGRRPTVGCGGPRTHHGRSSAWPPCGGSRVRCAVEQRDRAAGARSCAGCPPGCPIDLGATPVPGAGAAGTENAGHRAGRADLGATPVPGAGAAGTENRRDGFHKWILTGGTLRHPRIAGCASLTFLLNGDPVRCPQLGLRGWPQGGRWMTVAGMTSLSSRPVARLSSPGDIVATIPILCGFPPQDSVVLLSLRGRRRRLGLTVRLDLPPPELESQGATMLIERVVQDGASAAVVVIFGASRRPVLVDLLGAACVAGGIALSEALHVDAGRWTSYLCSGSCCPAGGTPVPRAPGLVESEQVLDGRAVLSSREELVRSLAAPTLLQAVAAEQALTEAARRSSTAGGAGQARRAALTAARAALSTVEAGGVLDLAAAAQVAVAVGDVRVRDEVATWALDRSDAMLSLTEQVARLVAAPFDAPVCTLLAWVAYARGDGARANVALDRALASDGGYSLALLLRRALDGAVPPREVQRMMRSTRRLLHCSSG